MYLNFRFACCFYVLYGFSYSVNIQCNYGTETYDDFISVYECKLQNILNIKSRESVVINSVNGSHLSDKSNTDVTGFYSVYSYRIIEYFPRNLENIFINLKLVCIRSGRLKEIQQSDLWSLSKLVYLDLDKNDIEFLEDGLFAYNPELVYVSFWYNKIIHIDNLIFENLNKLTWLYLGVNICIDVNARNSQTEVREVISQAKSKCFGYSGFDRDLQKLENSLLCVNSETFPIFDQKLQNLQSRFQNSTLSKSWSLKERFQAIISWKSKNIWAVKDKVSIIESSVTNSNDNKNLIGKDYLKYILIMLCSLLCLFNIVLIIIFKRFSM